MGCGALTERRQNIVSERCKIFYPISLLLGFVALWQLLLSLGIADEFLLPSPLSVASAFVKDFRLLMQGCVYTLTEAICGLLISIVIAYATAIGMDRFGYLRKALYPLLVLSQTIPYIAVAPLLVLWFGYNMQPKIMLVTLTCFFPLATGIYDGIRGILPEYMDEFNMLGGGYLDALLHVKIPMSLPGFFSSLKVAATYSIVGAVIAEWIAGNAGLGVYMTRVRKSYEFDKMFAVIFLIVILSQLLIGFLKFVEGRTLDNA